MESLQPNRNTAKDNLPKILSLEDFLKYKNNKQFIYVKDIKHTLKHHGLGKELKGKKKHMLEDMLNDLFSNFIKFNNVSSIEKIKKIQRLYRSKKLKEKISIYGLGILDKNLCNNREDFYTFEPVEEIEDKYFFSYRDIKNFIYFFDIRSFKKLIDKNAENPYTREKIPQKAIDSFNKRINYIVKNKIFIEDFEPDKISAEQKLKNRVVEVFQKIDELAGCTNINWFLNLSFKDLKNYYRLLEDIWNYRANLTHEAKLKIVPYNDMFQTSMNYIMNLPVSKEKHLKVYILNEIDKLISSADDVSQKTTGAYYVLTAFAELVPECAQSLPWLVQDGFN